MSDDRGLLDRLVESVAPGAGADVDPRAATFTRGLVVGALVGAAIAGSTIWQRRQAKREVAPSDQLDSPSGISRQAADEGGDEGS